MNGKPSPSRLKRFLCPQPTPFFFLRLALLIGSSWWFFSQLCIPAYVNGSSMLPTYQTGDFLFCWTPAFKRQPPQQGDIVMISYVQHKVMYLKRVVATAGQTVEFRNGTLLIDGQVYAEPWTDSRACDWNLSPVTVAPGHVYVVGDNRTMPHTEHRHGMVELKEIAGSPLRWWN